MVKLSGVISHNLRRFRHDRGLSQSSLAQQAGLAKQTIVDIELGRGNPTVQTLEALSSALGTSARALMTEMGAEVFFQPGETAKWQERLGFRVRNLAHAYGSGYVHNAIIRLDTQSARFRAFAGTRGMLRHCYIIEGSVELGPEGHTVAAIAGDFVRFPGEAPHRFVPITPTALVYVCTTTPQESMSGNEDTL